MKSIRLLAVVYLGFALGVCMSQLAGNQFSFGFWIGGLIFAGLMAAVHCVNK